MLDLHKDFDCVSHDLLLNKLYYYGITYGSYITGRRQYASINGKLPGIFYVCFAVPQESILEPLLFIIMIENIVYN